MKEYCPVCNGDKKSWMERSPDGKSCCISCGHIGLHTEWKKEVSKPEPSERLFVSVIEKWQQKWMNQTQNSEADHKNYLHRAIGVDANMKYSLANMLLKALEASK